MRNRLLLLAPVVALAACFDEPTPPRGIQIGGTEYNMNLSLPTPVRLPAATAAVSFRTVTGLQVVDSIVVTATGLKELTGTSAYQFWVVNGLTGTAWPVSHLLRLTRTDTAFNAGALTTSTVVTNRPGASPFFTGAKFNTTMRLRAGSNVGVDTVGQSGAFLVLTIQADSNAPAYTATTPKFLWFRFRNQQNTASLLDDAVIAAPPGIFGSLRNISDSTRYVAQGFGRSAFWDRNRDAVLHFSALAFGLPVPPIGYYYQPYARDTRTGAASRFGRLREKRSDSLLTNADLVPAQGTLVQMPDVRFGVREDSLACTFGSCGQARFTSFTNVQLVLEPKLGDPSYPNISVILQGTIPTLLTLRRPKEGTVTVSVMNGTSGVFAATVAIFGSGTGALIASRTTDPQGNATFNLVPSGPVEVRVYPPSPLVATTPVQQATVPVNGTVNVTFAVQ
jgi:hypothetical protein